MEKLRLTFNNTHLLSVGGDGSLCVFDIKDKETKVRKDGKELPTILHSDDVLIPKHERDNFRDELARIRKEILSKKTA